MAAEPWALGALGALGVYAAAVLAIVAAMLGVSHVLGQRHREPSTDEPFESGIAVTGSGRARIHARFYLVAMLFVIFDLEAVFLFAWAVSIRELGWPGFAGALFFIVILTVGLIYEWRMGAIDFGPPASQPRRPAAAERRMGKDAGGRLPAALATEDGT